MPVTSTPIFPQTIKTVVQEILPADTTALKTLYTGATNGSRIENIMVSSTDTSNRDIALYITSGGTDYLIATIQMPLNSGNTNAIFPVSLFQHAAMVGLNYDPSGNRYMYLESGVVLKVKATSTVTAAKAIQFVVQAGDY